MGQTGQGDFPDIAWFVGLVGGLVWPDSEGKAKDWFVWPVRGG